MELNHNTKTIKVWKFKRILANIPDDYDVYIQGEAFYNQINGIYINKKKKYIEVSFMESNDYDSIFKMMMAI